MILSSFKANSSILDGDEDLNKICNNCFWLLIFFKSIKTGK